VNVKPPLARRTRAILAAYDGSALPRLKSGVPRLAVIGAGLAGLAAAHVLKRAGLAPAVFEAASRVGGRTRTDHGGQEAGLIAEHGGEFIDSRHHDIMALATLLKLDLIDTGTPAEAKLATAYHFGGSHRGEAEVMAAYADVAPRIARDVASLSARVSRRCHTPADVRFDHLSVAEYLAGLDMAPWLRQLLEVAFVTVYGGDAAEQSSINMLSLIGTDLSHGVELFGTSDERYKVRDGADRITAGLAHGLDGRVYTEHRLLRLADRSAGYRLALQTPSSVVEIDADAVVLALPFTLLRQVELPCELPAFKRRVIHELGYGDNAKVLIGVQQRFWREQGESGSLYTDMPLQCGWDASRLRAGKRGILTCYLGGREGRAVGLGDAQAHGRRLAALAERIYPGFESRLTGSVQRVHWPSEPFTLGSYTCYRPGQWTTIAGDEASAVGNLYFAGEHCATASQGYMNGAAETGRRAAQDILRRLV